jgi:hypothetical protein
MGKDIFIDFLKNISLKQIIVFILILLTISTAPLIILKFFITFWVVFYLIGSLLAFYCFIDEFRNPNNPIKYFFMMILICSISWIGFIGIVAAD